MGITTIERMSNYLEILESLSGLKTQNFGFANRAINNKVNKWTFRFLTKGGKKLTSAMPAYVMHVLG